MITLDNLKRSICADSLFIESTSIDFKEEQNRDNNSGASNGQTFFEKLTVSSSEKIISVSNNILIDTTNIFRKADEGHKLSFRRNIDALLLVNREDNNWFILIEMKSGFSEVSKKAIDQIISSYIRMKHFFTLIDAESVNGYKECALVFSYQYSSKVGDELSPGQVKGDMMSESLDSLRSKFASDMRTNGKSVIDITEWLKSENIYINPQYTSNNLTTYNIVIPDGEKEYNFDIDVYLKSLVSTKNADSNEPEI